MELCVYTLNISIAFKLLSKLEHMLVRPLFSGREAFEKLSAISTLVKHVKSFCVGTITLSPITNQNAVKSRKKKGTKNFSPMMFVCLC